MRANKHILILFAILLLGFLLRLYNLDRESLWLDEGNAIWLSSLSLKTFIEETDIQAPFYFKILHYWILLLGNSGFSVRFLSLIFGLSAVFMMYKLGELLFDKEAALAAALLTATSPFQIQYSQEARFYSLILLLSLVSFYFFLRQFKKTTTLDPILYVLSTAALFYTHHYAVFILAAQYIYFLTILAFSRTGKLSVRKWLLLQLALLILYTPWFNVFIVQFSGVNSNYWLPRPTLSNLIFNLAVFSGSTKLLKIFLPLFFMALLNVRLDSCVGFVRNYHNSFKIRDLEKWFSNWKELYFLLLWFIFTFIVPFLISQFLTPIYHLRHTIAASGAYYLIAAKGIQNLGFKWIKAPLIILIIALELLSLKGYYTFIHKEEWRELCAYLDKNGKPRDLVLVHQYYCFVTIFDYYFKRKDMAKKPFPIKDEFVNSNNIRELGQATHGYNRIWLVMSHKNDPDDLILNALSKSYQLILTKQYIGIELYFFVKNE